MKLMHRVFQAKAKIVYSKRIKGSYFKSILSSPRIALGALPGQFVNIKLNNCYEVLLRRPFSIHRVNGPNIEVLYEVLGKGTQILAQKKPAEYLDIIGPLGKGFNLEPCTLDHVPILVAGGMGVAPLIFLADKLAQGTRHKTQTKRLVLIGAKTKKQILCEKEFKKLGCDVKIATDDGSRGFKGKVSDLLRKVLVTGHRAQGTGVKIKRLAPCALYHEPILYACGPRPMLKEIANISKKYNIPAQISLEEHMACGMGACLGCAVNTENGYQRVCKEGPVFAADEIVWEDKDE
jgi:dihydroorotate dehydrogenase electron transfer subunit